GGQVRADSAGPGRGAVFTVDLPGAPAAAVRALEALPSGDRRRSTAGALKGLRVWAVDDDIDAHEVLTLTLRQSGAEVECFASGQALRAALASRRPHIFLIDLAMPGEDGFQVLSRARAMEAAGGEAAGEDYIPA